MGVGFGYQGQAFAADIGSTPFGFEITHHFIEHWKAARPEDPVTRRDLGGRPPSLLTVDWIEAAFTPSAQRPSALQQVLAESDRLVDEVIQADVLVLGVPLYNYSYPAAFKAWIDQIVRVERTIYFDQPMWSTRWARC